MEQQLYQYTMSGLPNVYLENGYTLKNDSPYGPTVNIQDIRGLHKLIAIELCKKDSRLDSSEVIYLRKEMMMAEEVLADIVGVSLDEYQLWESGSSRPAIESEIKLRQIYLASIEVDSIVPNLIDKINDLHNHKQMLLAHLEAGEWREAA